MGETPVLQGLGSILHGDGVAFRVWAPHAQQVSVIGTFNDWDGAADPMRPEERGYWYAEVEGATVGDHYKYQLTTQAGVIKRIDPYAREATNSIGSSIQIMSVGQFAGMRSWGYNPSHIFAVDSDYGGSLGFKRFIKRAHQAGIAVILDTVYNQFCPRDLDLWQFDGWSENGRGGIYFFNDDRALSDALGGNAP